MASNSTFGDPTSTATSTATMATVPTSNPITGLLVISATGTSSDRLMASASQVQPMSQPRMPKYLQLQRECHDQLQPHQHSANKHHQPLVFSAQTPIQIRTLNHPRPQLGKASEPVLYPLASSGHGLLPTLRASHPQLLDQTVTVADPGAYPPTSGSIINTVYPPYQHQQGRVSAPVDSSLPLRSSHLIRAPILHPSHCHMSSVSVPVAARGIAFNNHPQPKAGSSPCSASDGNGLRDPLDKGTDDMFITIRDRKVRISDGVSIYALCRSWLRNGYPEESQPQYADVVKSLPKPLPMPMLESSSPTKRKGTDDDMEFKEDEKLVEDIDAEDLLKRHIHRAKRVRARLREERLHRIARYKSRLALLLPPMVEQSRSDTSNGL